MIVTRDSRAAHVRGPRVGTKRARGGEWGPAKPTDGPGRPAATTGTHRTAGSATLSTKGTLGYNVYIQGLCIGMQLSTPPLNAAKVLPYNLELVIGCPHHVYVTKRLSRWYKCCVGSSRNPSKCYDML
jgi:hypothetical protein